MTDLSLPAVTALLAAIAGIAFLYSSVGHGGATGYLAVMALLGVAPAFARPSALWMNCFVASVAFWRFYRAGFFNASIFVPLACASVPMAWLGSRLRLDGWVYSLSLALALYGAGAVLAWGHRLGAERPPRAVAWHQAAPAGAMLGFLAGLTGIGGGVYLTPALIFLGWTSPKNAAGISALFIVVNSAAGLIGLNEAALVHDPLFAVAPAVGITAALASTTWSIGQWNSSAFRRVLAIVLWIAATKSLTEALNSWIP